MIRETDDVPQCIVDTAEEIEADVVVLPNHTKRQLRRAMLGSVANRVLRTAPIPVILHPCADGKEELAAEVEVNRRLPQYEVIVAPALYGVIVVPLSAAAAVVYRARSERSES